MQDEVQSEAKQPKEWIILKKTVAAGRNIRCAS